MVLKKIGPDEFNISRSFKDVNISFAKNAVTKDTAVVKNENSIKQAIKNDLRGDLQKLDRLETLESEMAVMKGLLQELLEKYPYNCTILANENR